MNKIQKLWSALMIWRSIPAIIVYKTLSRDNQILISEDLKRISGDKHSWCALHECMLKNEVFRRQFFVRVYSDSPLKYALVRWTYRPLKSLEISAVSNQIGGGLLIYHGYSTIIFCHSMGKNYTVYQNVTIGRGKCINGIDVPIIGNDVTVYAGAIIIGGVHIGDHAVIGAGTVVTKDVPAYAVVVGQANRILKRDEEITG